MLRKALVLLLFVLPFEARAAWWEARSKHFIVYSEGSEERLRQIVADLEKYDFTLRWASQVKKETANPTKLKVYLMRNAGEVAQTLPYGSAGVAGYYTASVRGPIAVSTRADTGGEDGLAAQEVLFHELAHHFMHQHFPATYPSWYVEGFADYYGTTRILANDVIEVGHGVRNRYLSFQGNRWLPLSKLLAARGYSDVSELDLLYAQGWLLVHYLATNKERAGQLRKYLHAVNAGLSYEQAMNEAFGPGARKLDSELRAYSSRSRIMALSIPFKPIDVGPISTRTLDPAEEALIRHDIALGRGVPQGVAAKFAQDVRSDAARFPQDPHALRILAEAERAAGNHAAAAQAVERWLALRPTDGLALMHKAELQIEDLRAARSGEKAAWEAARKLLLTADKALPGNAEILAAYYNSFVSEGVVPPPGAQNALVRAFELVPQDDLLRHQVAADFEQRGMIEDAIAVIKPAALALHGPASDPKKLKKQEEAREKWRAAGDRRTETALDMLQRLEKKLAEKKNAAS